VEKYDPCGVALLLYGSHLHALSFGSALECRHSFKPLRGSPRVALMERHRVDDVEPGGTRSRQRKCSIEGRVAGLLEINRTQDP
jgi:hypothetical protein